MQKYVNKVKALFQTTFGDIHGLIFSFRFLKSCSRWPSASSGATGRLCKTLLSMASLNAAKSDLWTVGWTMDEFHIVPKRIALGTVQKEFDGLTRCSNVAVVKCAVRTHSTFPNVDSQKSVFYRRPLIFQERTQTSAIIKFQVANCKRSKKMFRLMRSFQEIHNKLSKKFPIIIHLWLLKVLCLGIIHILGWVDMWQVGLRKNCSPTFFSNVRGLFIPCFFDTDHWMFSWTHIWLRKFHNLVPKKKKIKFDQFCIYIMKMHTEMTVQRLTARGVASMNVGHVSLPFALEFRWWHSSGNWSYDHKQHLYRFHIM